MNQQNGQSSRSVPTPNANHPSTAAERADDNATTAEEHTNHTLEPATDKTTAAAKYQPSKLRSWWHSIKRTYHKWVGKYERLVADHWTYEILAMLLSIATLVAIVAVLFAYQNSPSPQLMVGVSLNTVISILATFSRASAVLAAASVIAQQKWLRMKRKDRTLIETLWYDDATRGPQGSLYLLWTFHVDFITALAATVMVLAVGFEPFVQQSVRYPLRNQLVSSASPPLIPTIQNLSPFSVDTAPDTGYGEFENTTLGFQTAITQGLYADSVDPLQSTCHLPTCDWPLYASAAFCSSCEDALDTVIIEPQSDSVPQNLDADYYLNTFESTNLDFGSILTGGPGPTMSTFRNTTYRISVGQGVPYTFQMNASAVFIIGGSTAEATLTVQYPRSVVWDLYGQLRYEPGIYPNTTLWSGKTVINGVPGPLKAFGYLNLTYSGSLRRLVATSAKRCIISLCAQQYSSTYQNGSLSSRVTIRRWGSIGEDDNNDLAWNATINSTVFSCGYYKPGVFESSDDIVIPTTIVPALRTLEGSTVVISKALVDYSDPNSVYTETTNAPNDDGLQFMSNISYNCEKIAQGLSNYIQQHGDGHAVGKAYTSTPFVEVRWAWLAYPITLVVIVLVVLITTIIQTKHQGLPTWKSSPFPLLFNYYDHNAGNQHPLAASNPALRPQSQTQSQLRTDGGPPPAPTRSPPPIPVASEHLTTSSTNPAPVAVPAANTAPSSAVPAALPPPPRRKPLPIPIPNTTQTLQPQPTVPTTKTSAHEHLAAKTTLRLRSSDGQASWIFEKVEPKSVGKGEAASKGRAVVMRKWWHWRYWVDGVDVVTRKRKGR